MLKQGTSITIYKFDKTSHQFLGNGLKREEFDNSETLKKKTHIHQTYFHYWLAHIYLMKNKTDKASSSNKAWFHHVEAY